MKVVSIEKRVNLDAVDLLEEWLRLAREGELDSVGLVGRLKNGDYLTASSSTSTAVSDAALYFEIGMRKLGFGYRGET